MTSKAPLSLDSRVQREMKASGRMLGGGGGCRDHRGRGPETRRRPGEASKGAQGWLGRWQGGAGGRQGLVGGHRQQSEFS